MPFGFLERRHGRIGSALNLEMLRGKRILVTGHTGFKGIWLCRFLKNYGAEIHGISLAPEKESLYRKLKDTFLSTSSFIDIRNFALVNDKFVETEPDLVIHMAAQPLVRRSYREPLLTFETNVMGTANVLQAAIHSKNMRGVIVITSDKVYKNVETTYGYAEEDALGGKDPYSASKSATEMVADAWRGMAEVAGRVKVVTARAGNIIGGGDHSEDRLLPDIIRSLEASIRPEVRNPDALRPWQHVLDPIYGYLMLASSIFYGKTLSNSYNFGPPENSTRFSVGEVASLACQLWGNSISWKYVKSENKLPESRLLWINSEKAQQDLGWRTRLSTPEAVRWTIEWHFREKASSAVEALDRQISDYMDLVS